MDKGLIKVRSGVLQKGLKAVSGAIEQSQVMQILAFVSVSVEGSSMTLRSSDTEMQVETSIPLEQEAPSIQCTLPAKKLGDICRSFAQEEIISIEPSVKTKIYSGSVKFNLNTLPFDQFPLMQTGAMDILCSISASELRQLLLKTSHAMASHDVRYFLNGMYFVFGEQGLQLYATDGHRLAYAQTSLETQSNRSVIVPRKVVSELIKLLAEEEEGAMCVIRSTEQHIQFVSDHFNMISCLIEGQYPDCQALLDANQHALEAQVLTQALKEVVGRASIMTHEKFKGIQMLFSKGALDVMANNSDQESVQDAVDIGYEGEDLQVMLNIYYLLDVLQTTSGERVLVKLKDKQASVLIEPDQDPHNTRYVIMPLSV